MATEAHTLTTEPAPAAGPEPGDEAHIRTIGLLTVRWVFFGLITVFAFHKTLSSVVGSTLAGSLNGFVWLIPFATVAAAIGVARRDRTELPIHDRQTDIIVGGLCLAFAVMLQAVLLERYAIYFYLLRIDLAALWLFVVGSAVMLFGLRPVIRFGWVFLVLGCMQPLFYQISVIVLGGNRLAAGAATVGIAAFATAVSTGRNRGRALLGAATAAIIGVFVLVGMAVIRPNASLFAYQMIPAMSAIVFGGIGLFFYSRRGGVRKRLLNRSLEPLASRQIFEGLAVVLIAAIAISLVNLPVQDAPPTDVPGMSFGKPLAAPAGWHQVDEHDFPWVRRIYGKDADLRRQRFVADVGRVEWDKLARPRTVIVDTTTTYRPFSLRVYPAVVMYDASSSRFSDPTTVDLGHGITGSMVTVIDDKRLLTYTLLSWTWRNDGSAQRVMIASVDNHEDNVVFPEPNGGLIATLSTMISVLFRGNQALYHSTPTFKDFDLLSTFGRALVAEQMRMKAAPAS